MAQTFTTIPLPQTVNHCANEPRKTMRHLTEGEVVMDYCRRNGKPCHIKAGTMGRGEPYIAFDCQQQPVISIF